MNAFRNYAGVTALLIGMVAFWEIAVRVAGVSQLVLPRPSDIILNIIENFGSYTTHIWATTFEIGAGFIIGSLLGIAIALVMTEYPSVRRLAYPIVIGSQTIPKIAIAPLVIIWFGVGLTPKIVIVALLAFFPVLINTMAGFEGTDKRHYDLMHSVNASAKEIYWHIRVPTAIPHIFAGLKLGITASVIGAIVGEWVASTKGLGYLLLYYTQFLDMISAFAVLVILVVLGVVCFAIIEVVETFVSWDYKARNRRGGAIVDTSLT